MDGLTTPEQILKLASLVLALSFIITVMREFVFRARVGDLLSRPYDGTVAGVIEPARPHFSRPTLDIKTNFLSAVTGIGAGMAAYAVGATPPIWCRQYIRPIP